MEIFSSMIENHVNEGNFSLIPKCRGICLSHLFFADDLMTFAKVEERSLRTLMEFLKGFSDISGLQVNTEKSTQIFAGKNPERKELKGINYWV